MGRPCPDPDLDRQSRESLGRDGGAPVQPSEWSIQTWIIVFNVWPRENLTGQLVMKPGQGITKWDEAIR